MQPVAGGSLGDLYGHPSRVAIQSRLQMRRGSQQLSQFADSDPEAVSRNLHDLPKRAAAQAEYRSHTRGAFIADYAGFDRLAVFQFNNERNQTVIRKIKELYFLVRLMKAAVIRRIYGLQVRTDQV